MKTIIEPSKYNYILKLPYTDETKEAIKTLRKEGKGRYTIRLRGSGPRVKWSLLHTNGNCRKRYDQSLPLELSTHVRIYKEYKK